MRYILLALCFICLVHLELIETALNSTAKNQFIDVHNDYRSGVTPSATNMKQMVSLFHSVRMAHVYYTTTINKID